MTKVLMLLAALLMLGGCATSDHGKFKMAKPKSVNGNFRGGMDDGPRGMGGS